MYRTTFLRAFHTTPAAQKTVTEKVSEVADTVNKKLGKGLASAIETGQNMSHSAAETVDSAKSTVKTKGSEAEKKMNQAAAGAREVKKDVEKEMRK